MVGLHHGLLLEVLDAADSKSDQYLMQGLFDGCILGVLLEVDYLLEINLRIWWLFCAWSQNLLVVVAARDILNILSVISAKRKDRMRARTLFISTWVCIVGLHPSRQKLFFCLGCALRSLGMVLMQSLFFIVGERLRTRWKTHVSRMDLTLLVSRSKLVESSRVICWLRGNASKGDTRISILSLKNPLIFFLLDAVSGR